MTALTDVLVLNRAGFWGAAERSTQSPNPAQVLRNGDIARDGTVSGSAARWFSDREAELARVLPGDIALTTSGEIGKMWLVDRPGYFASNFVRILRAATSKVVPEFLCYMLQTPETREILREHTRGATIANLASSFYEACHIPLPPLLEQRRIVALLDEAFDGIAIARANAEKNIENARAMFEGRLRSIFAVPNPEWKQSLIGEVCTLKSGTTVPKDHESPAGDFPYLKVADLNLPENAVELTVSSRYLDAESAGRNAVFPVGAVIFPKRGGAIATNKKRLTSVPACFDLNIMGVIPSAAIDAWFLYWYFVNVDMRQFSGNGASIPQVNNYDIAPLRISYPSTKSEQARVASGVGDLRAEVLGLERLLDRKLAALDELKKSLLHHAFAGEL